MQLLKQVILDILKEIGWVVIYGILTTMVIMAFILIIGSYNMVARKNTAISNFVNHNITMAQIKSVEFNSTPKAILAPINAELVESLDDYYTDVFADGGNGGIYMIMSGRYGYRQVILLLGVYANLTPFMGEQMDKVTFAVSNNLKEASGSTITIMGGDYPLHIAPKDMEIYHPLDYLSPDSELLNDTLFVFSHDYEAIKMLFPKNEYWELQERDLLGRFILKEPKEDDILRLRKVVAKSTGAYVTFQSTKDYISSVSSSGTRTHQTYMLFYISASITLFGAMLLNIYRILRRKIPDYITHHLFGASTTYIYTRMFVFVLAYHIIPIGGTVFIMSFNQMVEPTNIFLLLAVVFGSTFLITDIVYKNFLVKLAQGLRRE